ncbi:MAG: RimK/LysX family protein [Xanthomonadales bacterium]|nr:RimK/LysX family protein [Xanthomonadales bacterium]
MADAPVVVGWREWLSLPGLGVPAIKAKIDTGARSSALHVDRLETFSEGGAPWVRFALRPAAAIAAIEAAAPVLDRRPVTDSGGRTSVRPFILTDIALAGRRWSIEMNLTSRTNMLFPMLLGRTAMAGRLWVDPARSYCLGTPDVP